MAGGTDFTNKLSLPYLLSNQAQKHVTINESLRALDGLVQTSVVSHTLSDAPASPAEGEAYLIAGSPTGDWSGHAGELAIFADGGWLFFHPQTGWRIWIEDAEALLAFDGSAWRSVVPDALQNISQLGLGTTADEANPLSAKLNSLLFTALEASSGGNGDLRFTLNKEASSRVLSMLFQSGYSARAEIGLIGDDDLVLKVSSDGASFHEGLRIEAETGQVIFPNGSSDFRERLTSDRTYFVNAANGSNGNSGLTAGEAFATIQHAIDLVLSGLDCQVYTVTIDVADGVYAENLKVSAPIMGSGALQIIGNVGTPESCVISHSAAGVIVTNYAKVRFGGFHLENTSSKNGFHISEGGIVVQTGSISFENSASAIYVEGSGSVYRVSSGHLTFSSSGGATCALNCRQFGYAEISGRTVNFSGTPSYAAATVLAAEFGFCRLTALSFTGASAGKRYDVSRKAMIFTNSASDTYLPGTASGSSSADGLYV